MKINYYHIVDDRRKVSVLQDKCMKKLIEVSGKDDITIVDVKYSKNIFEMIADVDRAKFEIASSDPYACIVDTDCFIARPLNEITLIENRPYFAKYEFNTEMNVPDYCYFYVNGRCDWFRENIPVESITSKHYGLKPEKLKELSGFEYIPDLSYFHYYHSMTKLKYEHAARETIKKIECGMTKDSING